MVCVNPLAPVHFHFFFEKVSDLVLSMRLNTFIFFGKVMKINVYKLSFFSARPREINNA